MRKVALLFTFIAIHSLTFGQQEATTATGNKALQKEGGTWVYADSVPLDRVKASSLSQLEIPKTNPKDIILTHIEYTLLYNENHKQASWVAYELTKALTNAWMWVYNNERPHSSLRYLTPCEFARRHGNKKNEPTVILDRKNKWSTLVKTVPNEGKLSLPFIRK